jgi:hypothetical protein
MKDHSNPLSRPYSVRLAEQGFLYTVVLPVKIEPYTLDDFNNWLKEQGCKPKKDFIMTDGVYYFRDQHIATLFALRWL